MHIGILGGYPGDFARLRAPRGTHLHYIERDTAHLRVPHCLDAVLVVTRFANHNHWQQLRSRGVRTIAVEGGWTMLRRALSNLATQGVDSHE